VTGGRGAITASRSLKRWLSRINAIVDLGRQWWCCFCELP
jgi:hypothetical protein